MAFSYKLLTDQTKTWGYSLNIFTAMFIVKLIYFKILFLYFIISWAWLKKSNGFFRKISLVSYLLRPHLTGFLWASLIFWVPSKNIYPILFICSITSYFESINTLCNVTKDDLIFSNEAGNKNGELSKIFIAYWLLSCK